MASTITLQTYEQFVGGIIRTVVANTPLNDVNTGSVLFSLIEAIASNDFENAASILSVLELNNIDVLRNNDLDSKAADYGLTRLVAVQASGYVTITDSTITEISTGLYPVLPAPIIGNTILNVNNASSWTPTGQLYIGRGTNNFEGPIPYWSIVNNVTYWTINLGTAFINPYALQNDHLISETVIDGQGSTDRQINAGTIVQIPANNITPAIQYSVLVDQVIPAGESAVTNVPVLCTVAGSIGNAAINTITGFAALPFTGATVTNTSPFSSGMDIETDDELRNRIKAYPNTLARGTEAAILTAIANLSDPVQNDQIESAVVTEPTTSGEPAIIYIDDGTGFQPTYQPQPIDNILINANGGEQYMQLANFPLPRPQVVNTASAPLALTDGITLTVSVDSQVETVTFRTSDFLNITAATLPEIVTAINNQSTIFNARLTNKSANLLLYPSAFDAEIIQVAAITVLDDPALWANNVLQFPTTPFSYISLYQNNTLLRSRQESAALVTAPFNTWDVVTTSDLVISVDGTPAQDQSFSVTDFGGIAFSEVTLAQWAAAFNSKFAGVTATPLATGALRLSSNNTGVDSALNVLGGSLYAAWFPQGNTSAVGQVSDFQLNRENGNLKILTTIKSGDDITAGAADTKGASFSTATTSGIYNLSIDANNRPAEMVIVADAPEVIIRPVILSLSDTITVSTPATNIMRLLSSSVDTFLGVFATTYDFIYITNRGDNDGLGAGTWLDLKDCGLFKVIDKGNHTTAGVDTYIDVLNPQTVNGTYTVQSPVDIQAFYSTTYPQVFKAATGVINPPAAAIQDIVDGINANVDNVIASIFKTNSIKLTSSTETGGSIAIPVSVGNMTNLFATGQSQLVGNPSHVANLVPPQDAFTWFRPNISGLSSTWLNRYTYTDERGELTADAIPGATPPYNEVLTSAGLLNTTYVMYDDIINFTKGNNKGLYRSIRQFLSGDRAGTQFDLPETSLNHIATQDEIEIVEPLQFSANDSIVVIMDNNPTANTIDIAMARTGQVNAGNSSGPPGNDPNPGSFAPIATAFSANDLDGQPGIDFGCTQVWGTTLNNTNFNDYRLWFRARNWYVSGGASQININGALIVRATQFGPIGDNVRFAIDYPTFPSSSPSVVSQNNPFWTQVTYLFGSGVARTIGLTGGTTFTVTPLGSGQFQLGNFSPTITLTTVQPGDILSILPSAGVSVANSGLFSISAVNVGAGTINIYNPAGSFAGYTFTVTSANATAGATYTNNGQTFTVVNTIVSGTTLVTTGTGAPTPSGTLTLATGTGDATITFSSVVTSTETVTLPSAFYIFPLTTASTMVSNIASTVNTGQMMIGVVPVGTGTTITKATREESSGTIAYGNSAYDAFIGLYDGTAYVQQFDNTNPNFTLKNSLVLVGAAPAVYTLNMCPNYDSASLGEVFKLIPTTLTNLEHQLTQPAISTLPLVASVEVADNFREIQIKSLQVGSVGAIEVDGGRANSAQYSVIGNTIVESAMGQNFLTAEIPAYPDSLSTGDTILLSNPMGVARLSRLSATDTVNVVQISSNIYEYRFDAKQLNFNQYVNIVITDVSSSYSLPSGTVWRWTHDDSGELFTVTDKTSGTPVAQSSTWNTTSSGAAANLVDVIISNGSVTPQQFYLTVNGLPSQGDYFFFESASGATFAAWFSVNGNLTAPTGSPFSTATNQIMIPILSSYTQNQVSSTLAATLLANTPFTTAFSASLSQGASLANVNPGDIVYAFGTLTGWSAGNKVTATGQDKVSGLPIITVNSASMYFDVVNPSGVAMSLTPIGANSTVQVTPAAMIKWNLGNVAGLPTAGTTRYRIESLGFDNLFRLVYVDGGAPYFTNFGVAVDDLLVLNGSTFDSLNTGSFRIRAVDNTTIIFQNPNGVEEINTDNVPFNNTNTEVVWTSGNDTVTGPAGAFSNVSIGQSVKKVNDPDSLYLQVTAVTSTSITLDNPYAGISGSSLGTRFDMLNDVNKGIYLQSLSDIVVLEGDSIREGDSLFVASIANPSWFTANNTGTFSIQSVGTSNDYRPYIRISNKFGGAQAGILMSVDVGGLSVTEGVGNHFSSVRYVHHIAIDQVNGNQRIVYLTPSDRAYKFTQTNNSTIAAMGKIDFSTNVVIGVDGYLYYTGLLQTTQRTIDGFEPAASQYPGYRALGAPIELLPPLIHNITIAINVVTTSGVNLNDISNEIQSAIINYVNGLGVGNNVILSAITAAVMGINGVQSVIFTDPTPNTVYIPIANTQKAYIQPSDISIST